MTADAPFTDALRRYRESGPTGLVRWRDASATGGAREATVLRRLTRDLLRDLSRDEPASGGDLAAESTPANVLPIGAAREVPALELADDGTWRPSGAALASADATDASALRSVPLLRSRYPDVR